MHTERISDLNELHPLVKKQAEMLLALCKEQGLNARIIETYRSQARQNWLYEQGRTRPGDVVTWTRNSNHTNRRAFDLIQNVRGKEYDVNFLKNVSVLAKRVGLDWGGDWKKKDRPHFENQNLKPIPKEVLEVEKSKEQQVSAWAKVAWEECKKRGLLDGTRPKDNITREEMACVIYRLIEQLNK